MDKLVFDVSPCDSSLGILKFLKSLSWNAFVLVNTISNSSSPGKERHPKTAKGIGCENFGNYRPGGVHYTIYVASVPHISTRPNISRRRSHINMAATTPKPLVMAAASCYSSGPRQKRPGYTLTDALGDAPLGLSHQIKHVMRNLRRLFEH